HRRRDRATRLRGARRRARTRVPRSPDSLAPLGHSAAGLRRRHARGVLDDPTDGDPLRMGGMSLNTQRRSGGLATLAWLLPAALLAHTRGGEAAGLLAGLSHPVAGREQVAALG